jgi:AcrR family transcriptional regulator
VAQTDGADSTASQQTQRRAEILDAAARVSRRWASASVDAISGDLGATKGLIYHHFSSKSELFVAVNRTAMEMLRTALLRPGLEDLTPPDKLFSMVMAHAPLMMEQLPYLRAAGQGFESLLSGRTTAVERATLAEVITLRDSNEAVYIDVLSEGLADGSFRNTVPRQAVKPLRGALNWTSRWYTPRPGENRGDGEAPARQIATFVVRGVVQIGSFWAPS